MSEANLPENSQESNASSPAWFAGWGDFSAEPHHDTPLVQNDDDAAAPSSPSSPTEMTQDNWADWQTVDFPNALRVDAIAQKSPALDDTTTDYWVTQAAPAPTIDLPTWAQNDVETSGSGDQPPINDLISLIQELNQCNSALIDRVSQLEDALERSEQTLQAEIARSHDQSAEPQDLAIIHDQIDQLVNQLELAHQTNQRQQDLLETLSVQFDSSQERVAQLERECVQLQQRYTEQTQLLSQRDGECRNLQSRLQRQQRYTLQFKVALEKCLEVAPSPYESVADLPPSIVAPLQPLYESRSSLNPQPFLPKVPRIQPWSADQSQSPANTLKLESLVNRQPEAEATVELGPQVDEIDGAEPPEAIAISPSTTSHPGAIDLPFTPATPATAPTPATASAEVVEPAVATTRALELGLTILKQPNLSSEAIQAGLAELQAALGDWSNPSATDEFDSGIANDVASEPEADGDAEAVLWQDLARLIDVSTDDVVKVNRAKDFDSFEPTEAELTDETQHGSALDRLESDLAEQIPSAASAMSLASNSSSKSIEEPRLPLASVPQKMAAFSKEVLETLPASLLTGGSPSPIVYPLRRPAKKLESLAAVDLPTFPR